MRNPILNNKFRLLLPVPLFFLLILSSPLERQALAHARLIEAQPSPGSTVSQTPSRLHLRFSEKLEATFSKATVKDMKTGATVGGTGPRPAAGETDTLDVPLTTPLKPGKYEVSWKAISVDSHHTQGRYLFTVAPR